MEVNLSQTFPNDFAELGYNSLEGMTDRFLMLQNFTRSYTDADQYSDFIEIGSNITNRPITLMPVHDETTVFGIDTSDIILGDTGEGVLSAIRGSVVWREKTTYRYVRHGPFIFHITERNKHLLYQRLCQNSLGVGDNVGPPILECMIDRIRSVLERWLQRQLCEAVHGSLILLDGSLTTRSSNNAVSSLAKMLHIARNNQNYVLAFSKNTSLSLSGRRLNSLLDNSFVPCLLDIDQQVRSHYGSYLSFLGRIYAAKLSPYSFTFRLDVDRGTSEKEGFNAVSRLLGNDLLTNSYPETLRLSHILSKFSASEVLAMQRYVNEHYRLRIDPTLDVRQVLFGPYGSSNHVRTNGYDANL